MCPFCFSLSTEQNILSQKNMVFYCKNRCKEVLLCLKQDLSNLNEICCQEIYFSQVVQKFADLLLLNKSYPRITSRLINSRENFIENGYKFYKSSILEITKIKQFLDFSKIISPTSSIFSTDDEHDDVEDDFIQVRVWTIPYLSSFNQIQQYKLDIYMNYEETKIGYEGECGYCKEKYISELYKI
jgi:hypothetical protein